jgi:uncharacterized protein YbjT (DUF2867 family)
MIGQGVLRECLRAADVERVIVVGRAPLGLQHAKVREVIHTDFTDFTAIEADLVCDACFFCLGVSSAGMTEAEYTRVTHDFTLAAARSVLRASPRSIFIYVSGAGSDSTEKSRGMWARVKGRTENALLRLPFRSAYMLRPGLIVPMHGVKSKTRAYRLFYTMLGPALPLLRRLFPRSIITTEQLGRAMLRLARSGYHKQVLEAADLATF